LEPFQLSFVQHGGKGQYLQRDPPAQRDLLGLIDHPHPTPADLAKDLEVAQGPNRLDVREFGPFPSGVLRLIAELRNHLMNEAQGIQACCQLISDLGVFAKQPVVVWTLPASRAARYWWIRSITRGSSIDPGESADGLFAPDTAGEEISGETIGLPSKRMT